MQSWIQWTLQLDSIRVMRGKKELNPAVVPLTSILNSTDIQEVSWIQLYIMRTCNALKLNAMVYNWLVSGIQYTSQLNYYFHLFAVTSSFIMIFQIFKRQNVWFDPTNHVLKGYQSNRSNKGFMAIFNILKFNWTRATLYKLQDKIETVLHEISTPKRARSPYG